MGAPNQATVDLPLPMFGGRVTLYDPQTLPPGASPANRDVAFPPGAVQTRPGLASFFGAALAGNPTINYLKTFSISHNNNPALALDGTGKFYAELVAGVLTQIGSTVSGAFAKSCTAFGKEYIAFGDGNYGLGIPMQYDGTNFDRVSQVGPGAAPSPSIYNPTVNIVASPNGLQPISLACTAFGFPNGQVDVKLNGVAIPTGLQAGDTVTISGTADYNGQHVVSAIYSWGFSVAFNTGAVAIESGIIVFDLVTLTTATAYTASVGATVNVSGAGVAGYDGTWTIVSVSSGTVFVIRVTDGDTLANSGGGSIGPTNTGNVATGTRGVTVVFITRQGYYTKPAPPSTYIVGDSLHALSVGNIPIGPSNVVARVILITIAGGATFFILPSFYIYDNTTTSLVVNFLDTTLASGTDATALFDLIELGECASVTSYASRLFWAGERNKLNNFVNLTFDGGWALGQGTNGSDVPLGWRDSGSAGIVATREQANVVWGDSYKITAGAAGCNIGISQNCYQDYLNARILRDRTSYSIRLQLKKSAGLAGSSVNIFITSPTQGIISTVPGISDAQLSSQSFTEIIVSLIDNTHILPTDAVLSINWTAPSGMNGQFIVMDCIEVYPTAQPYLAGQVRGSYSVGNNPVASAESYNGVTSIMNIGDNYGEIAKTFFKLLDNKLYIVKERSLYVTEDDGKNEPSSWTVSVVSDTIGTFAVNGVDSGEGWAILADHTGVYICDGGIPIKISQEIQPDWDTINWAADQTGYVTVDRQHKRIHIGMPTGVNTHPNLEFVCDYSQLNDAQDIIAHPQAYYSTFSPGKLIAPGKARKWTIWNVSAYCAANCVRNDGTVHLLRGNSAGTGKIYDQVVGQLSDDGVAINSFYQTYFFPDIDQEQMLQLTAHRHHFEYLTFFAFGSGALSMTIEGPQGQRILALEGIPALVATDEHDDENNVDWDGERASFLFGTNAVGAAFTMSKFCPSVSRSITPVWGVQ